MKVAKERIEKEMRLEMRESWVTWFKYHKSDHQQQRLRSRDNVVCNMKKLLYFDYRKIDDEWSWWSAGRGMKVFLFFKMVKGERERNRRKFEENEWHESEWHSREDVFCVVIIFLTAFIIPRDDHLPFVSSFFGLSVDFCVGDDDTWHKQ